VGKGSKENFGVFGPGCHGPAGGPSGIIGDFERDPSGVGPGLSRAMWDRLGDRYCLF